MTEILLTRDDAGHVRPMARHDVPLVAAMIAQLARYHGDDVPADAAGLEAGLFAGEAGLCGFVIERFDHVIGYALIARGDCTRTTLRKMELTHLFILPGSRGLGLGRMLVDAVIAVAREAQCNVVCVGAQADHGRAQAFYAACGFSPRPGSQCLAYPLA